MSKLLKFKIIVAFSGKVLHNYHVVMNGLLHIFYQLIENRRDRYGIDRLFGKRQCFVLQM